MRTLNDLADRCIGSVQIAFNPHRDDYQSVSEYLEEIDADDDDISPTDVKACVSEDRLVELQFYPRTPTSRWQILGLDLDMLIERAHEVRP